MSGNDVETDVAVIHKREVLKTNASKEVALSETPKEEVADILIYPLEDDSGDAISMTGATLDAKKVTLAGEGLENKDVIVYYTYNSGATAQTFTITSDSFPSTYKIVGDTVIRNSATSLDEAFQVVINNAKVKPSFVLNFASEGDPSVFDMEIEILKEATNTKMITMIKY